MRDDGRFVARALFRTEEPIYGFLWAWGKLWASTKKQFGYVQPDVGNLVEIDLGQVPQLGPLEAGWRGVWLTIWLKDAEGKRSSQVSVRGRPALFYHADPLRSDAPRVAELNLDGYVISMCRSTASTWLCTVSWLSLNL